jgi:NTP pyrophosphatase (non-canonical NTP hydrolase)
MKKIESFEEYTNLANRTLADLGSKEKNLMHMELGFKTELGELLDVFKKNLAYGKDIDWVNVGEEIADYCWYSVGYLFFMLQSGNSLPKKDYFNYIEERTKDAVVVAKKQLVTDKIEVRDPSVASAIIFNISSRLDGTLEDVAYLAGFCVFADLDFWQILTNNIEKLKVRFPEKFTEENAVNRDLESERKELEK